MGDSIKKPDAKSFLLPSREAWVRTKPARTKSHQFFESGVRKGKTAEGRERKLQVAKQQQIENAKLAEADDEVARRKGRAANKSGRGSLIKSATPGLATNLGGTQ